MADLRTPAGGQRCWRRRTAGVVIAGLLGALVAAGGCGASAPVSGPPATAASSSPPAAASPAASPSAPVSAWHHLVPVGEGFFVEVLRWQLSPRFTSSIHIVPDRGTTFAAVEYKFVNQSGSAQTIGTDTEMVDRAGDSWQACWMGNSTAAQPEFQIQFTVAGGGARIGWIGYQIPLMTAGGFNRHHVEVQLTPLGSASYGTITCPLAAERSGKPTT